MSPKGPDSAPANDADLSFLHQEAGVEKEEELAAPDPSEVKAVRDILLSMGKVLKAGRVYDRDNAAYRKLFLDFANCLNSFLKEQEDIPLDIGQLQIKYLGETVYENPETSESLAFLFYRDGIRCLRFIRELELSEIEDFLGVLDSRFYEPTGDDDLSTIFWERDLPGIQYTAVDPLSTGEEGGEGSDLSSLSQGLLDHGKLELEAYLQALPPDTEIPVPDASPLSPNMKAAPSKMDALFPLSELEVEKARADIEKEKRRDLGLDFVALLLEMLSAKEEVEGAKEILAILERIADSYCSQGDFIRAWFVLRGLRQILDGPFELPTTRRNSIRDCITRMGERERLEKLSDVLNRVDEEEVRDFQCYVSLLNPETIIPLCELLGNIKPMKARRILCETIAEMARGNVHLLAPFVRDQRWFVARNMAYILGLARDPQGVKYLNELARNAEPRVQREVIRALGTIADRSSRGYLLSYLRSSDRFLQVSAAGVLANLREDQALPLLLDIIEDKKFLNRSREDKKEIFAAVGRLGTNEILPILRGILFKRRILHRDQKYEMKEGAAIALALIGTEEATEILEKGAKRRNRLVSSACRVALSQIAHPKPGITEEEPA